MKPAAEPLQIGVVQLVYVIPLCVLLIIAGYRKVLRAVMVGALITFLLNAAASASILIGLSQAKWG